MNGFVLKLLVGLVMGLVLTVVFIWTIATYRKEKRLTWWGLLAAIVGPAVVMPVTLLISGVKAPWMFGFWLWIAGVFVGLLWGFTVRIEWRPDPAAGGRTVAVGRNSILWVLFFATSFLFTYALMLWAPAAVAALGSLTAVFPAGMGTGTNLNQFTRVVARVGAQG